MSRQAVIELEQLTFGWNKSAELTLDIDELTIYQQERIFIEGASGSGKSTLLSILAAVNQPQTGRLKVLGQAIEQLSHLKRDHFRANHIGFIFQMFNLIPYLSMIENVILPCQFSKQRFQKATKEISIEQEALRLLDHLGLNDSKLLSKPVTELSIGQQQRVAAARALIGHPEIIIADEPTSSLDSNVRDVFLDLLFKQCDKEGSTLIFVSHDATLEQRFERTIHLSDINKASLGSHIL